MPSIRKKTTKAGQPFYEIRVSRGRGKSYLSMRWYAPDGWSKKAVERELAKVAAEFERQCSIGEVVSKAEKKEMDLQQKREAAKIMTVHDYCETVFLPARAITASEATRFTYAGNLKNWVYPSLGNLKMPDVTPANINALILSMQSKGMAHATVIKIYVILHAVFKMAVLDDTVAANPLDKVPRPQRRKDELQTDQAEAFTPDEVKNIIAAVQNEPLMWRCFILLLIDSGIRKGEACALRWENLDFKRNTITIAGNLCYNPQAGTYLDTPKSGHARTIDVAPAVMKLLRQLRTDQASHAISAFVFTSPDSPAPLHPRAPTRYFAVLGKKYGIPSFHPHKLRHTFATIAITSGADIASVSQKLGHADISTTLGMYTHPGQESMKRASDIFREALKEAGQG